MGLIARAAAHFSCQGFRPSSPFDGLPFTVAKLYRVYNRSVVPFYGDSPHGNSPNYRVIVHGMFAPVVDCARKLLSGLAAELGVGRTQQAHGLPCRHHG